MEDDGVIRVDGNPLRFYHLTGYDSGAGAVMLSKYAANGHIVHEMWSWYAARLTKIGQEEFGNLEWAYSRFTNGSKITGDMRRLYRHRMDLRGALRNPFDASRSDGGFCEWWWGANMLGRKARTNEAELHCQCDDVT